MSETKLYHLPVGISSRQITLVVEDFLSNTKKMTTQKIQGGDSWVIQAKEEATWKTITGMSSALTVQVKPFGTDSVNVEIGNGKWMDKLGAGAAGMIFFAPLALTAAFGAWKQKELPKQVLAKIDEYLLNGGVNTPKDEDEIRTENAQATAKAMGKVICPQCGCANEKGTKFCEECGEKLSLACPQCGAMLPVGKKFCPECGASVGGPAKCPNCGAELVSGKKFCAECGTKIG
jgi:hypothetical protein